MIRYLLDEHYPPSLAHMLAEQGVDATCVLQSHTELLGASDATVLQTALEQGRVVVTEDVTTFPAAIRAVPGHIGVVYCRSSVLHRTPAGLSRIAHALCELAANPPAGLGEHPIVWWLQP